MQMVSVMQHHSSILPSKKKSLFPSLTSAKFRQVGAGFNCGLLSCSTCLLSDQRTRIITQENMSIGWIFLLSFISADTMSSLSHRSTSQRVQLLLTRGLRFEIMAPARAVTATRLQPGEKQHTWNFFSGLRGRAGWSTSAKAAVGEKCRCLQTLLLLHTFSIRQL